MIYFISDTHFGHQNIIRFNNRPFSTVEEMNETMIVNWNERVHQNDTIFILGDMFYHCRNAEDILKRLHGKKHLIIGNHDGSWLREDTRKYFITISSYLETTDGRHALTLCHYPLLSYHHDTRAYMIHGHLHNNTNADFFPLLLKRDRVLNAGVDLNGFMPVTFEELCENNRIFKEQYKEDI